MRVMVVCLGNICRSPAGQAALEALRPDWHVESAGVSGMHVGEPPYGPMMQVSQERGLDLSSQRAQKFTAQDLSRFDLVLAMDQSVYERCASLGDASNLALFCTDGADVPDPYYTRDFEGSLDLIQHHARLIVENNQG